MIKQLALQQNEYKIKSKTLHTFGNYSISKKNLLNHLKGEINSNVGKLKLNSKASLNIEEVNNSLAFNFDANFYPKKSHLLSGLKEQNITIEHFPLIQLFAKGSMKKVHFRTKIAGLKARQNGLALNLKKLNIKGDAKPLDGEIDTKLSTRFDSSLVSGEIDLDSKLNYKDINKTLVFSLKSTLQPHGNALNRILKESNLTLKGNSSLKLTATGSMKKVNFDVLLKGLNGEQNDIAFSVKELTLKGDAQPLDGEIDTKLLTLFDSSVAGGTVDLDSKLNYKDINNTLVFDLNTKLHPHGTYLNKSLKESNLTLKGDSSLDLMASGSMKKVEFNALLQGVKGKQNDIKFGLTNLQLSGTTQPLSGATKLKLLTNFGSSVADGRVDVQAKLNYNNVEESLELINSHAKLEVHSKYLNPLLKEQKVALKEDATVELKARGKLEHLVINLDAKTKLLKDKQLSNITLHTSSTVLNIKKHHIEGSVKVESDGKDMGLNLESYFSGDYTNPKKMHLKNSLNVGHFNAFGVNLNTLQPLAIKVENGAAGLLIRIDSPQLQLKATSNDNNYYRFKLHTQKIVIDKIVKVPEELKGKFIQANLEGEATLSTQYFRVKGTLVSNKNFKIRIDAKNNKQGLLATLKTKELTLKAMGDLKKRDVHATLKVNSLKALQQEFAKLYPFEVQEIDGGVRLKAHLKGEAITAKLSSKKIFFEQFRIEALEVDAHYNKALLTLNKLNFKTRGFQERRLNQNFYLNQKGLVHLGDKRDVLIDIHPNIFVKAKGDNNNLEAKLKVKNLFLGYPEYGNVILTCDIDYQQNFKKKEITGLLFLDKLKIFYESKYLDPSSDNDVIVITKKDKEKKARKDNFLQNTFIDVAVISPEANYKTRDIDLKFTVDLKANKQFGQTLRMLGKIKDIRGQVIQTPKVFQVVDSTIAFRGGKEINPLLDLIVDYELPEILITISIHGNAKRPKLTFSSNPPLPKKDILSYLFFGVSTASLAEGKGSLGREAELFIMNQAAGDLAYEVGLDRVSIKDDGTGEGYAVQVGKKMSDNSMVIIENSKEGNSLILEYEVNKNIKVEVGHHQKTVPSQSIDVYFRKRFR